MKTNYRIVKEDGLYKPQCRNEKVGERSYEWLYLSEQAKNGYDTKEEAYEEIVADSLQDKEEVVAEFTLTKGKVLFEQYYEEDEEDDSELETW